MQDLSVIIVNWNTRELLRNCLASVLTSEPEDVASPVGGSQPKLSFELVVVDNGSSDGSCDMVAQEFPSVKLLASAENLGFARANNQGIRVSRGRYILLLNSDTEAYPGSLTTMVRFMDRHLRAGIVGSRLLRRDGSLQHSWHRTPTLFSYTFSGLIALARTHLLPGGGPSKAPRAPRAVDWVVGASLMIRRTTLDEIGPLDEGFFMFYEDTDWCMRAHLAGWDVYYLPEAQVLHLAKQSVSQVKTRMLIVEAESRYRLFRKHYSHATVRALQMVTILGMIARYAYWMTIGRTRGLPRAEVEKRLLAYREILRRSLTDHAFVWGTDQAR